MIDTEYFYRTLRRLGLDFFAGVPDSLLKSLCACISDHASTGDHVIAANEGGAVALGLGYHMATGRVPVVYMQNSGLGNTVNPLLSLADPEVYSVPMLLVLGWRGEPGVRDEPQHVKQGRITPALLDAMELPYIVLGPDDARTVEADVEGLLDRARRKSRPVALLVRKNTFSKYTAKATPSRARELPLSREDAIAIVASTLEDDAAIVATTGMASRELFELRAANGQGHSRDFLTVGGMGHASQIALGVALAQPKRPIYCLDGDGAVLMHMGALPVTGGVAPANYRHIVLNNGAHDSVGGQPTVGLDIDLCRIASACGYRWCESVNDRDALASALPELQHAPTPGLLEIRVRRGARSDLGRPTTTPAQNKSKFMAFLAR